MPRRPRLRQMAGDYLKLRDQLLKARTLEDRVGLLRDIAERLFGVLGYALQRRKPCRSRTATCQCSPATGAAKAIPLW